MMFNVLLPFAIILIIIEITKIIAREIPKVKVSVVIDVRKHGCKTYKMLMSVTIIDDKLEIEHFFILSFLSMSLFIK